MGGIGTLTEYEKMVLAECLRRTREIAARPAPPRWQAWEAADLAELREHGPRYQPGVWFGGGRPLPERHRVRFLRAVHSLASAGLIATTAVGGRTAHLRLTPDGERTAEALARPEA